MDKILALQIAIRGLNSEQSDLIKYLAKYNGEPSIKAFKQFVKDCYVNNLFIFENYNSNEVESVRIEYVVSVIPLVIDGDNLSYAKTDNEGNFVL